MHALFPISLDNARFTTEAITTALQAGLRDFEKVTFLVADRIQVYNDLAKMSDDNARMGAADWSGTYRHDLLERRRWLGKVRRNMRDWPPSQEWQILGFADLTDASAFESLRLTWLLYQADPVFRKDVDQSAGEFVREHHFGGEPALVKRLSVAYLVEEIAINVRIRLSRSVYSEFYMGRTLDILLKLYGGKYMKPVEELTLSRRKHIQQFSFFEWSGSTWVSRRDDGDVRPHPIRIVKST